MGISQIWQHEKEYVTTFFTMLQVVYKIQQALKENVLITYSSDNHSMVTKNTKIVSQIYSKTKNINNVHINQTLKSYKHWDICYDELLLGTPLLP